MEYKSVIITNNDSCVEILEKLGIIEFDNHQDLDSLHHRWKNKKLWNLNH